MLVMDITFEQMRSLFSRVVNSRPIYKLDRGTHWEFYMDASENIVLRSRKDKKGAELDAMFLTTLPAEKIIRVNAVVWGKHVVVNSLVQETREEPGENNDAEHDTVPDVPVTPEVQTYRDEDEPPQ